MKISRILIPVDFTDCSEKAVEYGRTMSKTCGNDTEFFLLHVVDAKTTESIATFVKEPVSKVRDRIISQTIQSFRKFVKRCDATEVVKDIKARELQVDLIIMGGYGSGGRGQIDEIFFGSTVEKVVRLLPCPVLCVPMGWPPEEY